MRFIVYINDMTDAVSESGGLNILQTKESCAIRSQRNKIAQTYKKICIDFRTELRNGSLYPDK